MSEDFSMIPKKVHFLVRLFRWVLLHPFRFLLRLLAVILLVGVLMSFFPRPSLHTTAFLTLPGSLTSLNIVGDDIYFIQLDSPTPSPFSILRTSSYCEIRKMPLVDFLAGKGEPKTLIRMPGSIRACTVSHDQTRLYVVLEKIEKMHDDPTYPYPLKTQNYFCSFDLSTKDFALLGPYLSFGTRLQDIEGKYLLEYGDWHISVSIDKGKTWSLLIPDIPKRRFAAVSNGSAFYMLGNEIFTITKAEIEKGTFRATKMYTLDSQLSASDLFVDSEERIYVTANEKNPPYLQGISSGETLPLAPEPIPQKFSTVKAFFKYGDTFYCRFWAADKPMTYDSCVIKVENGSIERTELFTGSPTFLGVVGDYLVFNADKVFRRKSEVFGIKFK